MKVSAVRIHGYNRLSTGKETRLNLFWLRYVSYAFLAGAALFYFLVRMRPRAPSRAIRVALYAACIVLACVAWYVQENNADQHSPRRLILGTVVSVSANSHRGGSIDDDFQVKLGGGGLSPEFSTDTVADSAAGQPIHQGDLLGVLYRTWDNVPLTIDELQGQRPGWHYRRYDNGGAYIFAVSVVGLVMLAGLLFVIRKQSPETPSPESPLNLNE